VTRPLRTIAILLVMGLLAIVALSVVAGRFRAKANRRPTETRQVVPAQPDPRH